MQGIMSRVEDLRQARARMEAVRADIYAAVEGKTDAELLCPPADGGWSAAEVLDHIATAERTLVKALTKHEKGEPTRIPRRAWFYRLPIGPAFWKIRFRAPRIVRPRPRSEIKPSEVLDGLRASRAGLFGIADRMGEESFASMVFPHFLLGRFTGLTWYRFIGKHEIRHLSQLRRVLAGPKVMRCGPAR
jgi:hypothetical protein